MLSIHDQLNNVIRDRVYLSSEISLKFLQKTPSGGSFLSVLPKHELSSLRRENVYYIRNIPFCVSLIARKSYRKIQILDRDSKCFYCGAQIEFCMLEKCNGGSHVNANYINAQINCYGVRHRKLLLFNLDHLIPKANGGTRALDNLVSSCSDCNQAKKDLPPQYHPRYINKQIRFGTKLSDLLSEHDFSHLNEV